ncbi:unnamed protein product, partial [Ectocarpus sp. 6 AP-2014]
MVQRWGGGNWRKEIQSGTCRATRSVSSRLLSSLAVPSVSCPPPAPLVVGLWSRLSARCRLASSSFSCQEVMNLSAPCSTTAACQGTPPSTFAASVHLDFGAVSFDVTASTCANGIPGVSSGSVCCAEACNGVCGGEGCGSLVGTGADDC